MENKRKDQRVTPHEQEPVEVQVIGDGFMDILTAKDIGPGGVGVYVSHGFQGLNIVCDVEVIISIPRQKSFKARGVIKHKRQLSHHSEQQGDFFGILFTQLCNKHRQLLEHYVEQRLSDKRRDVRVSPDEEKPVQVALMRGVLEIPAELRDISIGGMSVCDLQSGNGFMPGAAVDFSLVLPEADRFQLKGALKYREESENCIGICFNDLNDEQHESIKKYVTSRLSAIQEEI